MSTTKPSTPKPDRLPGPLTDHDGRFEQVHWRLPASLVSDLRRSAAKDMRPLTTQAAFLLMRALRGGDDA